jgi:hypothetical protein
LPSPAGSSIFASAASSRSRDDFLLTEQTLHLNVVDRYHFIWENYMRNMLYAAATVMTLVAMPAVGNAQSAVGGAVVGAGTGAVIGGAVGGGHGAAVGAAVGATTGAAVGANADANVYYYHRRHYRHRHCWRGRHGHLHCRY